MKHSSKPIDWKKHVGKKRPYSLHKTFGTTTEVPSEMNFNTLHLFPDQDADHMAEACTAYSQNSIASNEDGILYDDYDYTYRQTLAISGDPYGSPCDVMDSLKVTTLKGVKAKNQTEQEAVKRDPYFIVEKLNGSWYDGLISALATLKSELSVATEWQSVFTNVGVQGIVPPFTPNKDWKTGHNWVASGQTIKNGEPQIICRPHAGSHLGVGGEIYFNRRQIEALLSSNGAGAFAQTPASLESIKKVGAFSLPQIYAWCLKILSIFSNQLATMPPDKIVPPPISPTPVPPQSPKVDMIEKWAQAIAHWEGADPRLNNPGNMKYTTLTASWGGIKDRPASDHGFFCRFPTLEQGHQALYNFLKLGCEDQLLDFHNARTLRLFTIKYAGNPPEGYVDGIANEVGVSKGVDISTFLF